MKAYNLFLILLILVIFFITLTSLCIKPNIYLLNQIPDNTSLNSSELNNVSTINSTLPVNNSTIIENNTGNVTASKSVDSNYIINNIHWSQYPSLERLSVHNYEVTGPNTVINHTFIVFSIDVNIKNPDNVDEIFFELAGVVLEIRQILGPDSSPDVWGLVNGVDSYNAIMLPYDNRIYVSDHYHQFAFKNDIYLIPGDDIYDYHSYTIVNNSVIEP